MRSTRLYYGSGHLHQINYSQRSLAADLADMPEAPEALAMHQLICDIERDDLHQEILRSQGTVHTRYAHDALGRLTGAWSQSNSLNTQPFDPRSPGAAAWADALTNLQVAAGFTASGLLKAWQYDKVGELQASRHSLRGDTGHRYDATSRVLQTSHLSLGGIQNPLAQAANESFGYDPAGNIQDSVTQLQVQKATALSQRGYVRDNLVRVYEDKRYFYDGHGRLIRKLAGKHTAQTFGWDEENHLIEVATTRRPGTEHESTQTTRFDYDAIGRRIAKHDSFGTTTFIWEGMRLLQERRGASAITYVYEPGSYVPLARLDADGEHTDQGGLGTTQDAVLQQSADTAPETREAGAYAQGAAANTSAANDSLEAQYWAALSPSSTPASTLGNGTTGQAELCKVYYFHTDQVGMPQELTNAQGQLVWQASYKTWGSTVAEEWEVKTLSGDAVHPLDAGDSPRKTEQQQQNLRFQGQYLDRDTGLHYNTFRYYDPDMGRFICQDPIGLYGDINLHRYAPNPISNIDPFGWDWNYNLTDANGNVYYHGRASDNQTMADVIRRHSSNTGYDGVRLGSGDAINQVTLPGTDYDLVRGIEDSGIREKPTLGRGSGNVRGNVIHGISDAKRLTKTGMARVEAAVEYLRSMGVEKVSQLKSLATRKC